MTNEQVKADIAANLPDNSSRAITPAKVRTELGKMVDYSDTVAAAAVAGLPPALRSRSGFTCKIIGDSETAQDTQNNGHYSDLPSGLGSADNPDWSKVPSRVAGSSTEITDTDWPTKLWLLDRSISDRVTVKNYAISGMGLSTFSETAVQWLTPTATDLLIIYVGTNDYIQHTPDGGPFTQWKSRFSALVATAKNAGAWVVTIAPARRLDAASTPFSDSARDAMAEWLRVSSGSDVFIDAGTLYPDPSDTRFFETDKVHLSSAGKVDLAKTVFSAFAGNRWNYAENRPTALSVLRPIGGVVAWNLDTADKATLLVSGAVSVANPTTGVPGRTYSLLVYSEYGSPALTWGSLFVGVPAITGAGKSDYYEFLFTGQAFVCTSSKLDLAIGHPALVCADEFARSGLLHGSSADGFLRGGGSAVWNDKDTNVVSAVNGYATGGAAYLDRLCDANGSVRARITPTAGSTTGLYGRFADWDNSVRVWFIGLDRAIITKRVAGVNSDLDDLTISALDATNGNVIELGFSGWNTITLKVDGVVIKAWTDTDLNTNRKFGFIASGAGSKVANFQILGQL